MSDDAVSDDAVSDDAVSDGTSTSVVLLSVGDASDD